MSSKAEDILQFLNVSNFVSFSQLFSWSLVTFVGETELNKYSEKQCLSSCSPVKIGLVLENLKYDPRWSSKEFLTITSSATRPTNTLHYCWFVYPMNKIYVPATYWRFLPETVDRLTLSSSVGMPEGPSSTTRNGQHQVSLKVFKFVILICRLFAQSKTLRCSLEQNTINSTGHGWSCWLGWAV